MTRKRKAEDQPKQQNKKKNKKNKKKGGRALESNTEQKPNGSKCKSENQLEKIPTYNLDKIPKGLLSIRDISQAKKKQMERQLELDGLEYSFDIDLDPE